MTRRHPFHDAWVESNVAGWKETDMPSITVPVIPASSDRDFTRMTSVSRAERERVAARRAIAIEGYRCPESARATAVTFIAAAVIGVAALAALVIQPGPSDAEALRDAALDLQDAQQQARAERRGEIHQAQALAMLAASGRK